MVEAWNITGRAIAIGAAAVIAGSGCGSLPEDDGEPIGEAEQGLDAHCSVKVTGVGTIDV